MNVARRRVFLLAWSLAALAACLPARATPPTPAAAILETRPATLTASAPALTASALAGPTQTATQTSTFLADTPAVPAASLTPEPPATPTPPASVPPTSEPPATAPPASQAPTIEPPTSQPPTSGSPTPCAFTWFVANPPPACPGEAPVYAQTVAQHFERGVLIWRERPDFYGSQIYAFFYDQKWPYWNPTNDQWRPNMPESDPNILPPTGFFQPVRGFGMFWRNAYFGTGAGAARDRLGWATDQEFSLGQLPMQCRHSPDRAYGCLVSGPDNQVYDIGPNNVWSIWPNTD